jgi:dCMP deaminase
MKHKVFNNIALELANLSKCKYTKVACIAVEEGRIKATGVNGTPSNFDNCCDVHFEERDDHKHWSDDYEIHAEMNMILDLARSSSNPSKLTIYTTLSPCKNCLKHLIGLNRKANHDSLFIDKIVYNEKYHRLSHDEIQEMKDYALRANIELLWIGECIEL